MFASRSFYLLSCLLLLLLITGAAGTAGTAGAADWPHYRGPAGGIENALPDGELTLEVSWKRSLGAGYSGLASDGERVVTMFTAGADDVLAAFKASDGSELWRLRLGAKYEGHDGSEDGPLSTPTLDGEQVFALGPHGHLVAAQLSDGKELWRLQLDAGNSTIPEYGYTASPVVAGDLVLVATGGPGRSMTAFDRQTGEIKWTRGDDSVTYQTPVLLELDGTRQWVAVTDQQISGLDLASGDILWQHAIAEGNKKETESHPTPAGDDRLLIDLEAGSKMIEVKGKEGAWQVTELWQTNAFQRSTTPPVYHQGFVYGFTGRILSAADANTGELAWRSRQPSGDALSLVDGHLVALSGKGEIVIAVASPSEYVERARLKIFEAGDFADPIYAGGRFFVRNQSHLASFQAAVAEAAAETTTQEAAAQETAAQETAAQETTAESTAPAETSGE